MTTSTHASSATYDTWKRATSQEHFEKIIHGERRIGEYTLRQLCILSLKLCKQLPYSPITWLFLIILGAFSAFYALVLDGWVQTLFRIRNKLMEEAGPDTFWGFITWTSWCVLICLLSTSCGQFLSAAADGSGIPRMRALFAGVYQNPAESLCFKAFIARSIGTVLTSGAGISTGRSGPYTHLMSMIAYQLSKFPLFRRVYFGPETFLYLRAAVACGITASFGSPLGGVLYSIEVTARFYEIKCLWEGVICSAVSVLVFRVISFLKRETLFDRTNFTAFDMDWDIFYFVLLGAVTGLGAGIFCRLAVALRYVQNRMLIKFGLAKPSFKRRVVLILTVAMSTAFLTHPLRIMRLSDRALVNEVFRDQPLSLPQWTQITEFPQVTLFIYIGLKYVTSIIPCGSPMSFGVFGPLFTIGAAVGRLYGETLMKYWNPSQSPATYAVVGAACFASSATQTVSTSVIFFELTGQLSHMVPVMMACIVAYFVCGTISPSIYDILAEWAGLHSVCYDFNEYIMNQKFAGDNMSPINAFFTKETTYSQALQVLSTYKSEEYFPICEDVDSQLLIGCVRRFDLEVGIARYLATHHTELPENTHPTVAKKILKLVSDTLRLDKLRHAVVEDISLLNFDNHKEDASTSSALQFGPPFAPFAFTSIPIENYPPQVGEEVNLNRVHRLAAMYMWTQVYVVKHGRLLGVINLDSSLNKVRTEEVPVLEAI